METISKITRSKSFRYGVMVVVAALILASLIPTPESFYTVCSAIPDSVRATLNEPIVGRFMTFLAPQWKCSNGGYWRSYGLIQPAYSFYNLGVCAIVEVAKASAIKSVYYFGFIGSWYRIPCFLNLPTTLALDLWRVHATIVFFGFIGLAALLVFAVLRFLKLLLMGIILGALSLWALTHFSGSSLLSVLACAIFYFVLFKKGHLAPIVSLIKKIKPPRRK